MKDILPSMPKGEIIGKMAVAELMLSVKVVIDGNLLNGKELRWQWLRCNDRLKKSCRDKEVKAQA